VVKDVGVPREHVLLTPNDRRVVEGSRRDCCWLYVARYCDTGHKPIDSVKDPARIDWHEVWKMQHYWLAVDAVRRPLGVAETESGYC